MKTAEKNRLTDNGEANTAQAEKISITPPQMNVLELTIRGDAPLVLNRFGRKAQEQMRAAQAAGPQGKKGKKREAKDFQACFEDAKHVSKEGWCGFHAGGLRTALVDACRLVGFKMTHAKLGVFILADGYDRVDHSPLVRITKGEPVYFEAPVKNDSGVADIRARPMWAAGWEALVRLRYDAEMFSSTDMANLLARVGAQVGIGEGRPNSKSSTGCGWGTFAIVND